MTVFIDPPMWPAHETLWSHLVSDASLDELHNFSAQNDIPLRAFDRDHYDVPARAYDRLVEAGAQPISAGELVRRLRASGLRVTARERHAHATSANTTTQANTHSPAASDSVDSAG